MCRGCFSQLLLHNDFYSGGIAGLLGKAVFTPSRRSFMACSVGAASALSAVGSAPAFAADEGADLLLRGGTIRPLAGAPTASAIAIKGGKVLAVGDDSALSGLKTGNTKIVELDGRTVLPGLIDPHNHTILAALIFELLDDVGYAKYPTREKLVAYLKKLAATTPKGQWIVGSNFDNLLQGGDFTRPELDAISTDHPIFIWYTNGHDAGVNSDALKVAGIPEDVGALPGGGHFGRGPDGKLNGIVYEESAMLKFAVHFLGKITPEVAAKAVTDYARHVASVGNTLLHEPGTIRSEWIGPFTKLSNTLAVRTSASVMFDDMKGLEPYRKLGLGKGEPVDHSLFSLYGVKIVGDGSNQTETGAQTRDYLNTTSKGSPNFDAAKMKQMVAEVQAFGLPVQIHCNGDYTIDIALDAIEAAYKSSTAHGVNRIEHATMARPDQILRMKALNVQPSFLMNHVRLYGAAYRDQIFGPERAAFMDPAGACVKAGLPFTLHTDGPCSPPGPLALIGTAVTRRCIIDNSVVGPDQMVSLDDAIRAVTIDAARQLGQGDRLGSLEPGKEADFTILESNPYKVRLDAITDIRISETWVAGERKFAA
ncbi:amidohydrolase [uncultured Rhodoblastus sp.]|uniref:amidohydrolase n=1 Tax=uncultured Rhodoblastus sp. TaxID=543037 RepID=UPI0025CF593F|nr:amidohydrolase [uncultured Rhodoblastus sp.]